MHWEAICCYRIWTLNTVGSDKDKVFKVVQWTDLRILLLDAIKIPIWYSDVLDAILDLSGFWMVRAIWKSLN